MASLDYRLRNADYLRNSIEKLLSNLGKSLVSGFYLVWSVVDMAGAVLVRGEAGDTTSTVSDEHSADETESVLSSLSEESTSASIQPHDESDPQWKYDIFEGYLEEVVSII